MFKLNKYNNYYTHITSKAANNNATYNVVMRTTFDDDGSYYVEFIVTKTSNNVVRCLYSSDYIADCIDYYNNL